MDCICFCQYLLDQENEDSMGKQVDNLEKSFSQPGENSLNLSEFLKLEQDERDEDVDVDIDGGSEASPTDGPDSLVNMASGGELSSMAPNYDLLSMPPGRELSRLILKECYRDIRQNSPDQVAIDIESPESGEQEAQRAFVMKPMDLSSDSGSVKVPMKPILDVAAVQAEAIGRQPLYRINYKPLPTRKLVERTDPRDQPSSSNAGAMAGLPKRSAMIANFMRSIDDSLLSDSASASKTDSDIVKKVDLDFRS